VRVYIIANPRHAVPAAYCKHHGNSSGPRVPRNCVVRVSHALRIASPFQTQNTGNLKIKVAQELGGGGSSAYFSFECHFWRHLNGLGFDQWRCLKCPATKHAAGSCCRIRTDFSRHRDNDYKLQVCCFRGISRSGLCFHLFAMIQTCACLYSSRLKYPPQ